MRLKQFEILSKLGIHKRGFFLGGTPLGEPLAPPMGTPNGTPNKFWVEPPKTKVAPPIIFKKYFGKILVRFMNMVYGIVFGFSETHLTFLERIS